MIENCPRVTVIMPIRNEADYIKRSLRSVLVQNYPTSCLEILVVDGGSEDGTREIVNSLAKESAIPIVLLDNPARVTPVAFNIGLCRARGEVVIIIGGHCSIASDYVQQCVKALRQTEADCVGGPMVTMGKTPIAEAIALAQSSPFGVGGVAFRTGHEEGSYVDTVAFGAYRREVFDRIGNFDEELIRNQDDEFNFRLTQTGGKIWLDPSIRSIYYSRATLRTLWKQYYQYGLYKVRVIQKRRAVPSWRHLVPVTFVLSLLASLFAAFLTRRPRITLLVAGPYAVVNLGASMLAGQHDAVRAARIIKAGGHADLEQRASDPHLQANPGHKADDPSRRNVNFHPPIHLVSLAFATLHLAYGWGFLKGLWHWRRHWFEGDR